MLRSIKPSVLAGYAVALTFGFPSLMVVVTGGLKCLPILLLPFALYVSVRWQCRLAYTLKAAREAWAALDYLDN